MLDIFVRVAFYLVTGLALAGACAWYVQSAYQSLTGRSEVVIAPFEVVGSASGKDRGLAFAHMLHTRLREIEQDIREAQRELMSEKAAATAATGTPAAIEQLELSPGSAEAIAASTRLAMPQLLTQAVELRTGLLEPAEINITVGGVQVAGVVEWVQRFISTPRMLVLTLYERKDGAQLSGSLRAFDLTDDAVRLDVPLETGQDAVPMDKVVECAAYEIIRRRLAQSQNNRLEVLSGSEFQTLVEVLRDTARLNRRVFLGRGALPEFQDLLAKVAPLADEVPEWYQLNYLAASVAESAKDLSAASKYYGRVRGTVARTRDPQYAELSEAVGKKLDELRKQLADSSEGPETSVSDVPSRSAKKTIEGYVHAATSYLNSLLGHNLPPPQVQVVTTNVAGGWVSYWDGQKVVVPQATQYLPDIAYRESSWPHIMRVAGSEAVDNESTEAILYSFADIFPMLVQQHETGEDADTSRWELAPGWVEMASGGDLAKAKVRTPYLSFAKLGTPQERTGMGATTQVAHMRHFDTKSDRGMRKYINCGILNKAFYEAARRLGSNMAAAIWVDALKQMKKVRKPDFPRFAVMLNDAAAPADRQKLREALLTVGLDPQLKSARAS